MTLNEVEKLLERLRNKMQIAWRIQKEIKDLEDFGESVSPKVTIASIGSQTKRNQSSVESFVLRLESKREKLMVELQKAWDIEDEIAVALDTLTEEERTVIVDFYMNKNKLHKIAVNIGYSYETAKRRKKSAIKKLSEN